MSDSESSEGQELRVEQKMQAKLRDLLDRGKAITPFYDDDTLLLIYKDCFQTDHVFINKLEIIAKNHAEPREDDQDWIRFKQQRAETGSAQTYAEQQQRPRFYFLEDQELLERARRFDPERERGEWQRRREEARERQDKKFRNNQQHKNKHEEGGEEQEPVQVEKKLKFKEKEEKTTSSSNNQPAKPLHEANSKGQARPAERKETQAEKKAEAQQTSSANTKPEKPYKSKPLEEKSEVKQHPKPKYQEKKPKTEGHPKPQPKIEEKQPKVQHPVAKKQTPAAKTQVSAGKQQVLAAKKQVPAGKQEVAASKQEPITATTQPSSQNLVESPAQSNSSQKYLKPDIKREFEQSCRANSFILKFIEPIAKLQKISYIRDPNGTYRQVKTREILPK